MGNKKGEKRTKLTAEEAEFQKLVRSTYNSGRVKEAYELAADFYRGNPESLFAKYTYAGMAGDYSDNLSLSAAKREQLLAQARQLMKEVYDDERTRYCDFYDHVRNEYFWFHQLHAEQYELGVERVAAGNLRGYYSMCS